MIFIEIISIHNWNKSVAENSLQKKAVFLGTFFLNIWAACTMTPDTWLVLVKFTDRGLPIYYLDISKPLHGMDQSRRPPRASILDKPINRQKTEVFYFISTQNLFELYTNILL